jgi:hypothetical protein
VILQPADILLFRVDPGAPLWDRAVGWGERFLKQTTPQDSQYYHVAFVSIDTTQMYSSQPPKIDLYPIPQPLPSYIQVYRSKVALTPDQLKAIFTYAESRRGRIYPFLGVLTAGWLSGNLEFCSQFAEDSFAEGDVLLSPKIRFTTPDDIAMYIPTNGFSLIS